MRSSSAMRSPVCSQLLKCVPTLQIISATVASQATQQSRSPSTWQASRVCWPLPRPVSIMVCNVLCLNYNQALQGWPNCASHAAGQDRQHFMLTTMDTLDSISQASPAKVGEVERVESLPRPVAAEHSFAHPSSLLASLPSRIGALWGSPEHGAALRLAPGSA